MIEIPIDALAARATAAGADLVVLEGGSRTDVAFEDGRLFLEYLQDEESLSFVIRISEAEEYIMELNLPRGVKASIARWMVELQDLRRDQRENPPGSDAAA